MPGAVQGTTILVRGETIPNHESKSQAKDSGNQPRKEVSPAVGLK